MVLYFVRILQTIRVYHSYGSVRNRESLLCLSNPIDNVQQINVIENLERTIFVTFIKQLVKILYRAKQFIDVLIIGNVITQIDSRRRIYRVQPNGVDS